MDMVSVNFHARGSSLWTSGLVPWAVGWLGSGGDQGLAFREAVIQMPLEIAMEWPSGEEGGLWRPPAPDGSQQPPEPSGSVSLAWQEGLCREGLQGLTC